MSYLLGPRVGVVFFIIKRRAITLSWVGRGGGRKMGRIVTKTNHPSTLEQNEMTFFI